MHQIEDEHFFSWFAFFTCHTASQPLWKRGRFSHDHHPARLLWAYLAGFHRCGDEGGLRHELGGAQQISNSVHISLILFHRLHLHLLFWQQSLITWCVAWWRQELEVTVPSAQQETNPNQRKVAHVTWLIAMFYVHTKRKLNAVNKRSD